MKKIILGFVCGVALSVTTGAYASETIQSILFSGHFLINGQYKDISNNEYASFNYNGHVYVPLRFVAENMSADVKYDDTLKTVIIQQNSVKFDNEVLAPVPLVTLGDSDIEIPIIQGSSCWRGCVDKIPPDKLLQVHNYKALSVPPSSKIAIKYPKSLEPQDIYIADYSSNQRLTVERDGFIRLPKDPGIYTYQINSHWNEGSDTVYVFEIEIK